MNKIIHWLLGIKESSDVLEGGVWSVRLQALPDGAWAVLAVALGCVTVCGVVWLYRREGRDIRPATHGLLIGLRLAVLACLAAMLVEAELVISKEESVPARLLVLVDDSASMSLKDPFGAEEEAQQTAHSLSTTAESISPQRLRELTRSELALRAIGEVSPALADQRELFTYRFSGDLQAVGASDREPLHAAGAVSAIGDALKNAFAAHRGQPLAGVLLVSDGQSNAGEDPRKVAEQAGRDGVVVQALAIGTSQGPTNARLVDLEASPVVFVRDPTEITVLYESRGMEGHAAVASLEVRQDGGAWTELGHDDVVLAADTVIGRSTFKFTPEATGQYEFRGKIGDAGAELSESDNVATRIVKVVRQRVRALLVAGHPAPELQFLRNALLRDTGLEFASWLQSADDSYEQAGHRPIRRLPANLQELSQYDAVVLFDPDMRALGSTWSEMLLRFVGSAGGGLVFVAGELDAQQLLSGDYGGGAGGVESSWLRVLPVVCDAGLYRSNAEVQLSSRESWTLDLTPDGQADSIFRFADDPGRNREILTSLPGMFWHCRVTRAKPGATVLAVHGDARMHNAYGRHVLLAVQRYGPGQSVFIGFDSTYRWRYLHEAYFDGFWARLIDRVGRGKALGGRYPFILSTDKSTYQLGDRAVLCVEWIQSDSDAGVPSDLKAELEVPNGEPVSLDLEPDPDKQGTLAASFAVEEAGPYMARVAPTLMSSSVGDETELRPATLSFRVEPHSQEFDKPALDRGLLDDMTRATGGKVFTLTDYRELPAAFHIKAVKRVQEYRDELWDAPLLFGGLLVLITAEWVLRKKSRMA